MGAGGLRERESQAAPCRTGWRPRASPSRTAPSPLSMSSLSHHLLTGHLPPACPGNTSTLSSTQSSPSSEFPSGLDCLGDGPQILLPTPDNLKASRHGMTELKRHHLQLLNEDPGNSIIRDRAENLAVRVRLTS